MGDNKMNTNTFLEDIEGIAKTYKNYDLINLSDWNPSNSFIQNIASTLPSQFIQNGIPYIFSSEIDDEVKEKVKLKLGFNDTNNALDISFFDSGSLSIVNVIHLLSIIGIHHIAIISPSYFSVEHICKDYLIECHYIDLERKDLTFSLPHGYDKTLGKYNCIWITNPIYCTGIYLNTQFVEQINNLIANKNVILVIDESLSEFHHFLSPKLVAEQCITIVSPHKALCTNGMKFSAILFPSKYYPIIDTWSDIISGCLSLSSLTAIHHFLSSGYDEYLICVKSIMEKNRTSVLNILKKYQIECDTMSQSYLLSIYFPNLPYNYFDIKDNIIKFIDNTAAYFIPNSRNHFPKATGLSFRLNLCSVSVKYLYALERAVIYLKGLN